MLRLYAFLLNDLNSFASSGSNKEVPARVVAVVQSDEEDAEETFSFTYKETISEVELNKYIRIFTLPLTVSFLTGTAGNVPFHTLLCYRPNC